METIGITPVTADGFEKWVEAAAADSHYPLHITSIERWDDVGIELWARTIFDLRDSIPVGYQSVAALGRLWEIPSQVDREEARFEPKALADRTRPEAVVTAV